MAPTEPQSPVYLPTSLPCTDHRRLNSTVYPLALDWKCLVGKDPWLCHVFVTAIWNGSNWFISLSLEISSLFFPNTKKLEPVPSGYQSKRFLLWWGGRRNMHDSFLFLWDGSSFVYLFIFNGKRTQEKSLQHPVFPGLTLLSFQDEMRLGMFGAVRP